MDEAKFKFSEYRSGELVNGIDRAAHRALLYCTGLDTDDLHRPLVGVVNSFTEMVPGHIGLRELADYVKQGVWQAGGIPREFSTIALCDGICQGHSGMRYPLPSRENIADAIEMMIEAHHLDAMVMLPGCDKIVPGMIMAAARCDIPTVIIPAGPMLAGSWKDRDCITLTDMREFIGQTEVGKMTEDELLEIEKHALPTYGTCAMLGTANSMSFLSEILGLALPHSTTAPAVTSEKRRYAKQSGKRVVEMIAEGLTARKILTRAALLNGVRAVMAMGASTNTVLHLMSIAHEAGAELTLEDFDRISREVPYLCNIKPSGKYPMEVFHAHGGVQAVLKAIAPKLDPLQLTVTGKTVLENLAEVPLVQDDVIFPLEKPKKPEGGLAILHGNLAPDGAVVKKAGVKPVMYQFTGKARVFDYMEDACKAIQNDEIAPGTVIVLRYEGPKGGPGMQEMLYPTSYIKSMHMGKECALITDGRFSGGTSGLSIGHISPEAASGGNIGKILDGDIIEIDIPSRSINVHLSDEELVAREQRPMTRHREVSRALRAYAQSVSSADKGGVRIID